MHGFCKLDQYIHAVTRDNTRQSYQAAICHFEVEWGGFLPATADSIARYLADHADTLSINTLRHRLAALAQWHLDQGFPDPTKTPVVRNVFRGISLVACLSDERRTPSVQWYRSPFALQYGTSKETAQHFP